MAGPLALLVMCVCLEMAWAHRFTTPSDPSSLHSKVAMLENHYEELQKKFRIQTDVFEAQNHKLKNQLRSQAGKLRDLQDRNDRLEKEQQQMLKTFSDLSATLFKSKWSGQPAVQEILTTTPLIPKASGYGWSLDHIIQNQTRKMDQLETENRMLRDVVFRLQEKGSSMEAMLIENSALLAQLGTSDRPGFQNDPSRRDSRRDVSIGSLGKLVASQSEEIRTLRRIFLDANDTLSLQRRRLTSLGDLFQGQGMVISKQASVLESLRKTTKEVEAVVEKQGAEVGQTQRDMETTKRDMRIMDRQVRELDLKHSMVTTQLGWKYNQLKNMVPGGEKLPPLTIEKPQRTNSLLSPSTTFSTNDNEVSTHDMQDLSSHLQDHIKATRLLPEKVTNLDRTVRGHNIFITEFQRRETEVYKMLGEHEKLVSQVMQATDAIQQYIAIYMNSEAIGPELRQEWEDRHGQLTSTVNDIKNELKDLKVDMVPKMDKLRGLTEVERSVDDMGYKVTDLEDKVRNIQYTLATMPRH
ncbi:PREDICTED: uncharacterized protein LOC109487085 [Branchiostoma belcheri]|uniref:Uncharacterized protein LOC109487085 n=1 Tax=Branchiostoma belcheri TaxID=7741 RepID=A0A6P4ZZT4_BRABE|nr:PREDICTED: uncharacterized protein LOC109487085 [Branchiostoma belcheri]XP_019646611.1 PREDICTED: uncharacterized protein LOC109487085 [Branchiostoma belcheri]XP_019646612.1 PREDICTED: uncharacterized protein LOC109487085 [Branchiostoma belcheri]XP_019646613.1 PREDICTED: uncharacterized protein LOC109487085 [Branchiostoma belcheri]